MGEGPHKYRAMTEAFASAVLFGVSTPLSKWLLPDFQANQLAGLLYLGAALFLMPFLLSERRRAAGRLMPRDRKNLLLLGAAVFFGGMAGPVLLLCGLRLAHAASVSMWLNLETVATAVLAVLVFRESLGLRVWMGNAGVVVAGLLLTWGEGRPGVAAVLCVAGAALCWGVDNNCTALIDGISPQASTFWKGLVAGSANLAVGLLFFDIPAGGLWLWALALGGLSFGASITLYITSAQRLGAARSQMVFSCAPFFGVFLSVVWLGETLGVWQAAGAAVLAVSIAVIVVERHGHAHVHDSMEHTHSHRHDDGHHPHTHGDAAAPDGWHSHTHTHAPLCHTHSHWPDLHHRHPHG